MNECETGSHTCQQECENKHCNDGLYKCSCEDGYTLDGDGETCNG